MEKTLVVMAAGMGSRFGGLKQIEPMGPSGEFILDYSIYDAIKAGFTKVVFVIKEELLNIFKETIGHRVEKHIKVEYVFQKVSDVPFELDFIREKPWGTGQAILCAKEAVEGNFAVINADDFYGADAFIRAAKFLDVVTEDNFGLVGYKAVNTLTENGSVKRGVLEVDKGKLARIEESSLVRDNDHIHATSLVDNHEYDITLDALVSMNLFLFSPKVFEYLENDFVIFLNNLSDPLKDEFLLPSVVTNHIASEDIKVEIIDTIAKWYGVTYKEDTESVKNAILDYVEEGVYKKDLWS